MSKDFNHFLSDPKNFSDYEGRTQVPLNQNYDQSFTFSSLISIKLLLSTGALRFFCSIKILKKHNY